MLPVASCSGCLVDSASLSVTFGASAPPNHVVSLYSSSSSSSTSRRTAVRKILFRLNTPPGYRTSKDLDSLRRRITVPYVRWSRIHTSSPGLSLGNSRVRCRLSYCRLLPNCLALICCLCVSKSDHPEANTTSELGIVVLSFLPINNSHGLLPVSKGEVRYANRPNVGSVSFFKMRLTVFTAASTFPLFWTGYLGLLVTLVNPKFLAKSLYS